MPPSRWSRSIVVLALIAPACGSAPASTARAALPDDPYELPAAGPAEYAQILAGLRGTPVLVNIWASWCPPCRHEAPYLAAAHERYGDRVTFVGIDILDERGAARDFMREFGWTYPSLFDVNGDIRDDLGLLGQPVTLFYDASGELVDTWNGPLTEDALRDRLRRIAGT